jgi:peptidoglycan-associated lipoprotein
VTSGGPRPIHTLTFSEKDMPGTFRLTSLALVAVVALAACSKKEPPPPPAPEPAPAQTDDDAARRRAEQERLEQARRDSIARAEAEAARLRAEREAMLRTLTQTIYYDFDSDALSEQARSLLDAKLGILNANSGLRILIAGHADERGSDAYNMALGQRRAASAKRYLTQRGVADNRIEIISYGEERPAAQGSDEAAWSQNRRSEFEVTAGANDIKVGQ